MGQLYLHTTRPFRLDSTKCYGYLGLKNLLLKQARITFFVVWKTKQGDIELLTAGLDNGRTLEGVTRYTVLDLVRSNRSEQSLWQYNGESLPPLTVVERDFSINEMQDAVEEGRLI